VKPYYASALLVLAIALPAAAGGSAVSPIVSAASFDQGPVRLSPSEFSLAVGETITVTATSLSPAVQPYEIYSHNPSVAFVSGTIARGESSTQLIVVGVSPGQAEIEYRVESIGRGVLKGFVGLVSVVPCQTPIILTSPSDQTTVIGKRLTLSVQAVGLEPLTCDWFMLDGTTASPLHLESHSNTFTTAPLYRTTTFLGSVSSACGTAASFRFTVIVLSGRSRSVSH